MNIKKGKFEESVILENGHLKMLITKKEVGNYIIEIKKDKDNKRIFTVPYNGLMDFNGLKVHEVFESFIASIFGNTVIHGEYKAPKTIINFEDKTITILSDNNNNAILRISYTKEEIKFEIIKFQENDLNSAIYLYNDGNLRGGYIRMFRELFESLNILALEPIKPQERIKKIVEISIKR